MKFKKIETGIDGLYILEPKIFGDNRGFFMEVYNIDEFRELGIEMEFVQDNHSKSKKGVLRGMHLQIKRAQGKLVRVVRGAIYDVVVDLREGSPTYGKWYGEVLSEENRKMCCIPPGFAHGFLTLKEDTEIVYKCTDLYSPQYELGIMWDDKTLGIDWRFEEFGIDEIILSEKDKNNISFCEYKNSYYGEKVLLLGAEGQLGREFQRFFDEKKIKYIPCGHKDMDVRDIEKIEKIAVKECVSAIINCVGYNNVDRAEIESSLCYEINGYAPGKIAALCKKLNIPFVTYSTDYVFDGKKEIPYTEEDIPNPLSVYGKAKLLGEKGALIYEKSLVIRPSWIFGALNDNFAKKIITWAHEREQVKIVDDQVSAPTYTKDLVRFTWTLLEKEICGLYHFSNSGECSKYDEAFYILGKIGGRDKLKRAKSEDFSPLAQRPVYSKLDNRKAERIVGLVPHWKDGIDRFLKEVKR